MNDYIKQFLCHRRNAVITKNECGKFTPRENICEVIKKGIALLSVSFKPDKLEKGFTKAIPNDP